MFCPHCHTSTLTISHSCADCGYSDNGPMLERLSNLTYILNEIATWSLAPVPISQLAQQYAKQKREVEVDLGLRPPLPTAEEAYILRTDILKFTQLQTAISYWLEKNWLPEKYGRQLQSQTQDEISNIYAHLQDIPPSTVHLTQQKQRLQRWDRLDFVRQTLQTIYRVGKISPEHYQLALAEIEADMSAVEYATGLQQRPIAKPQASTALPAPAPAITAAPAPALAPPKPPPPPRQPWTWERLWDSLLSERTLKAILFLGVLLLFAAAVSWVASNWNEFTPLIQGTFLAGVTAVFFAMGWFVRVKQKLHESGVAITAVAGFLVPLDFLVYYLSGGFPAHNWPEVWLAASITCVGLYLILTVSLQAEFFGYLLALAITSLLVSLLNWFNIPWQWWQAGAAATALSLAIASQLCRTAKADWRIFGPPLGRMALLTAVPLMLVGAGLGYLSQPQSNIFYIALALSWWLGGGTLLLMIRQYRLTSLVLAAALAFPIAVYFSLDWTALSRAYFATGWALLASTYLVVAYWLGQQAEDEEAQLHSKIVLRVGWLLVILAALWPLMQPAIARSVHLWLALTMAVAALLWQRASYLWPMSFFLLLGATMWQGSLGAAPAEVALSWSLLAVLLVATAVWLESAGRKQVSLLGRQAPVGSSAALFGAGWLIAALSLLPPALFSERPLLAYALGNWIGINGWLAYIAHQQYAGIQTVLNQRWLQRLSGPILPHWLAAMSLLPWLGLVWANRGWAGEALPLAYTALAWGLLTIGLRVRRWQWAYGKPWLLAAHLGVLVAFVFAVINYGRGWFTAVTFLMAFFHFTAAYTISYWRSMNVFIGGVWLAVAWISGLSWLGATYDVLLPALALLVLGYTVVAKWLADNTQAGPEVVEAIVDLFVLIGGLTLLWSLRLLVDNWGETWGIVPIALAYSLLGMSALLQAWQTNASSWGHMGVWANVFAGGLLIQSFSRGSGRSAALAALLAIGLILTERGLHYLSLRDKSDLGRRAWLLYRQPLLVAGWVVSAGAIGLALLRNLILLGGGPTRQGWSTVALFLITGFYALSAYFYKRTRFIWLASILVIFAWTLLTNLLLAGGKWHMVSGFWALMAPRLAFWRWYGVFSVVLCILMLLVATAVGKVAVVKGRWLFVRRPESLSVYQEPVLIVTHCFMAFCLWWAINDQAPASILLGLGVLFYGIAVWMDYHFHHHNDVANNRFLYPALILLVIWVVTTLDWLMPFLNLTRTREAMLVLAFSLPLLMVGRWVRSWQSSYQWPFYVVAYGTAVWATLLVWRNGPFLAGVVLYNAGLGVLSTYLFRKPLWLSVPMVCLPWFAWLALDEARVWQADYYAWTLLALATLYLLLAYLLREEKLDEYSHKLLTAMVLTIMLGLLYALWSRWSVLAVYSWAAALLGATAVWQRKPIYTFAAAPLLAIAYGSGVSLLAIPSVWDFASWSPIAASFLRVWAFAAWPGIAVYLLIGWALDEMWGVEPFTGQFKGLPPFPWYGPERFSALWQRVLRWWGMPFYGIALFAAALSPLLLLRGLMVDGSFVKAWQFAILFGLGTAVFTVALFYFRLRGWLVVAWIWLQFAYINGVNWLLGGFSSWSEQALAFIPMMIATAGMGLLVQSLRKEVSPFAGGLQRLWFGWSRPFFAILALNLLISQLFMRGEGGAAVLITLFNMLIIAVLATFWQTSWLLYLSLAMGWWVAHLYLNWLQLSSYSEPVAYAVVAAIYGIAGYALLYLRQGRAADEADYLAFGQRPLRYAAWFISAVVLIHTFTLGSQALSNLPLAIFFPQSVRANTVAQAMMWVAVLSILGLFYLAAAVVERQRWLGYGSVGIMLIAWCIWLLYRQQAIELQYYALPASIYLLGVAWIEWQQGSRDLAAWIDRAAILLMFGSAFWQSFGHWGFVYALLMMLEGLGLVWLGSMRLLRRLLYAGVAGVVTAVVGQLVRPLINLETYVFLILGVALLAVGILIEQRREKVLQFAHELKLKLENWE